MAQLGIDHVSKIFPNGHRVLDDIDIDIASDEFVTLLGPSGCGKTTLLKAIAGFHPITSGRFVIAGKDVTTLPPEKRDTAMCFQSYALFPHLTVAENILFGPRQNRVDKAECDARLADVVRQVDLSAHVAKLPSSLSGGQQQRVALARAMAMRPGIILFDEPLSNLDAKLREQVRFEIRSLQAKHGYTAIYVTHDQAEALAMSDRIVILNSGRVEQVGDPQEIYRKPKNRFIADFIGAANVMQAEIIGQECAREWRVRTGTGEFNVASSTEPAAKGVYLCWRPEDGDIVHDLNQAKNIFSGTVVAQAFQGNVTDIILQADIGAAMFRLQLREPVTLGQKLSVNVPASRFCFLEAVQ